MSYGNIAIRPKNGTSNQTSPTEEHGTLWRLRKLFQTGGSKNEPVIEHLEQFLTADETHAQMILQKIQSIFRNVEYQNFDFGMESEFIIELEYCVQQYGIKGIEAIASIILKDNVSYQVSAEALRWLGGIEDPRSHQFRLRLLGVCLQHHSRWVRDGAALGLDAMDDPRAIPLLRLAIAHEGIVELRKDMQSILSRLEH